MGLKRFLRWTLELELDLRLVNTLQARGPSVYTDSNSIKTCILTHTLQAWEQTAVCVSVYTETIIK